MVPTEAPATAEGNGVSLPKPLQPRKATAWLGYSSEDEDYLNLRTRAAKYMQIDAVSPYEIGRSVGLNATATVGMK